MKVLFSAIIFSISVGAQTMKIRDSSSAAYFKNAIKLKASDRDISAYAIASPNQSSFAEEVVEKVLFQRKVRFHSEVFDVGSGGTAIKSKSTVLVLRIGKNREYDGKTLPNYFGYHGNYQEVRRENKWQETQIQEYFIPVDAQGTPGVAVDDVVDLVALVNSSSHLTQEEVSKQNPKVDNSKNPTLTDKQFLAGVKNLASFLDKILEPTGALKSGETKIAIGGSRYYIYGSGYPPNDNVSLNIDVAFDVSLESFKTNMHLTYLLAGKNNIVPENGCGLTALQSEALQRKWLDKVSSWVAADPKWDSDATRILTCD